MVECGANGGSKGNGKVANGASHNGAPQTGGALEV